MRFLEIGAKVVFGERTSVVIVVKRNLSTQGRLPMYWAVHSHSEHLGQMNTQIQAEEVHFPRPVSGLIVRDRVRSLVIQESRASPKC